MQESSTCRPRSLCYPLPPGMRIVNRQETAVGTVFIVQMALPIEVLDLFSEALELAARVTGNPRLGMQIISVAQEFVATWRPTNPEESDAK